MSSTEPTLDPDVIELDEASIAAVAGGINPQPVPPRHEDHHLD